MAKQLKLRITRVITSSFQSCRSKDPSILPSSHPVPSFSRFSPPDHHSAVYTHPPPPPSSAAKHHRSSSAAASNSNNQQLLHWQNKEEEWQLVYHNSSTTKKQPHKKTSTESSRTFSSDSSPTSSSTEFDHFNLNKHKKPRKKKKKRRNNRKVCVSSNGLCRLSVSSSSPARLSVFKKLIPNLMEGKVKDSFAVVKKSEDPYDDFKRSMMDMIWEKQMFDENTLASQIWKDFVDYIIREDRSVVPLADDRGWTAIHYAAFHDWVGIVPDLLKCHTDHSDDDIVNTRNGAILIAAKEGHLSVIKGLLYIHKESDTGWDADFRKKNMLHLAVEHNQGEVVEFVLHNSYLNKYYCRGISFLNAQDYNGNTALHLSVMSGNFFPNLINHAKVSKTILNRMNLAPYDLLYVDDEIVGDQLQIKEAFDALRSNQRQPWKLKFWHKDKLELSSTKGSIKPTKRSSKNKIFNELRVQNMKEKVKLYQKRTNTQIIVAALITTVTFTVGFTMPGGYHQSGEADEGFPVLTKKKAFAVFMAADAIALLFSTASLFLYFISSLYENAHKISAHILIYTVLNIISIVAMMVTFMMGTYVVLAASRILTIFAYVISSIFFLFVIITLLKFRSDFKHGQIN